MIKRKEMRRNRGRRRGRGRDRGSKKQPYGVRLQILSSAQDPRKILQYTAALSVIGLQLFVALLAFFSPRFFGHIRVVDKKK